MKYTTDKLMSNVARLLRTDMRINLRTLVDPNSQCVWNSKELEDLRGRKFLLHEEMDPYTYKVCAQVNSFLKRYTFQQDLLSPAEREAKTNAKFIVLQEALAASYSRQRTVRCHEVLRLTRKIARKILSTTTLDPQLCGARFGTKATIGCPAADAYIDRKLNDHPLTGSAAHIQWFKDERLSGDKLLETLVARNKLGYLITESLSQVNVPKKFDIDRGINPNTLLGSLYTDAIGKCISEALRLEGLDIRKLQKRHGVLARRATILRKPGNFRRKSATADLSDASHGFLSHHLNAMLPREWYRAVMRGVIRRVEVDGRDYRLESIMTMGIGFTFPMQTLLFYCLLKAISILTGVTGIISVYGDDLIYPVEMHHFVVGIFSDLGFKLNLDKTFVHSSFKESCGSDYFKGVDVRPYSPEGDSAPLTRTQYAAFCYKLINGFLRRWEYNEIQIVVDFLLREVTAVMDTVFLVDSTSGEDSGVRIDTIPYKEIEQRNSVVQDDGHIFFAPWRWNSQTYSYEFPKLIPKIPRRFVTYYDPYYWDKLRIIHNREFKWEEPLHLADIMGKPLFGRVKRRVSSRNTGKGSVRKRIRHYVSAKSAGDVAWYQVHLPKCTRTEWEYSS